jgi:hypothetical protein
MVHVAAESYVGIKIFAESEYFDGPAKIVYVRENVGMGIGLPRSFAEKRERRTRVAQPGQRIDELGRNIR